MSAAPQAPPLPSALGVQLVRFVTVGGLAAVVDFTGYRLLLWWGLTATPAKALSIVLASATAYWLNRRWTFRSPGGARRAGAFTILYTLTFAVNVGINAAALALLPGFSWRITAAWAVAGAGSSVINFVALRTVVFRSGRVIAHAANSRLSPPTV